MNNKPAPEPRIAVETPEELGNVLKSKDDDIDRLSEVEKNEFEALLQDFEGYQEQIEAWQLLSTKGELGVDQSRILNEVRTNFYDLYYDLIRFSRLVAMRNDEVDDVKAQKEEMTFRLDGTDANRAAGVHEYDSPVLARNVQTFEQYTEFSKANPAFIKLGNALYYGTVSTDGVPETRFGNIQSFEEVDLPHHLMIPQEQLDQANVEAEKKFEAYCELIGIDPEKAVTFKKNLFLSYGGNAGVESNERLDSGWNVNVSVELDQQGNHLFFVDQQTQLRYGIPPHITALHELGHAERYRVFMKQGSSPPNYANEVAQVINQIIYTDEVYKKVNNISIEEIVEYPQRVPAELGEGISLGELANVFRTLKKDHSTVEEALMSAEGWEFVEGYYENER